MTAPISKLAIASSLTICGVIIAGLAAPSAAVEESALEQRVASLAVQLEKLEKSVGTDELTRFRRSLADRLERAERELAELKRLDQLQSVRRDGTDANGLERSLGQVQSEITKLHRGVGDRRCGSGSKDRPPRVRPVTPRGRKRQGQLAVSRPPDRTGSSTVSVGARPAFRS